MGTQQLATYSLATLSVLGLVLASRRPGITVSRMAEHTGGLGWGIGQELPMVREANQGLVPIVMPPERGDNPPVKVVQEALRAVIADATGGWRADSLH